MVQEDVYHDILTVPTITRRANERKLVHPTKMAIDREGKVIITDQGEFFRGLESRRGWRAKPDEFGVVMHFSRQRPITLAERKRIQRAVTAVVEEHKPGQTYWSLEF